jgi:hypothetical protein
MEAKKPATWFLRDGAKLRLSRGYGESLKAFLAEGSTVAY